MPHNLFIDRSSTAAHAKGNNRPNTIGVQFSAESTVLPPFHFSLASNYRCAHVPSLDGVLVTSKVITNEARPSELGCKLSHIHPKAISIVRAAARLQ